ncbi:hypothetical protein C8R46DRAFT_267886 [Mycena filopes]|nr:hypothetical protein C8R46DRAFT_267886 [Mycena filopes]
MPRAEELGHAGLFSSQHLLLARMPDITIIPAANLTVLVFATFLYGLLFLLFLLTVYFLATRRTLAGIRHTRRHHFTSLAFIGLATLFLVVTVHWSLIVYQAFYAFIHLATITAEDAFYTDLRQKSEVAKGIFYALAVLLGEGLVTYRLWIIWGRNRLVVVFPVLALVGVAISSIVIAYQLSQWEPTLRATLLLIKESAPWSTTGFTLSLVANIYSTGLIIYRILRQERAESDSRLLSFLSILAESATLQMVWVIVGVVGQLVHSDTVFIAIDTFPAIIGISNTLIHARVGLGLSPGSSSDSTEKPPPPLTQARDAV